MEGGKMEKSLDRLFLGFSMAKLNQLTARIMDCLGRLQEDQIWARGSENENAVGNLVLHLCGNLRQWILTGIGGVPDVRVREREFAARGGANASQLADDLRTTVVEAVGILDGLTAGRLCDPLRIQAYDTTVLEAIYHVVEHFAQHTGQIIYATKLATGADLGYTRLRRPSHNQQTP
jgi:uncharacterized damage-inducible protein DinB